MGRCGVPSGGVSRAPDSHGGDQTSQQHQEPWCQSALPGRSAHVPARVAAARAATPPTPPMPSGRCSRRCCRSRPARPARAAAPKSTAAGSWWTRSGMSSTTGACGGHCRLTSRPGLPSDRCFRLAGLHLTALSSRLPMACSSRSAFRGPCTVRGAQGYSQSAHAPGRAVQRMRPPGRAVGMRQAGAKAVRRPSRITNSDGNVGGEPASTRRSARRAEHDSMTRDWRRAGQSVRGRSNGVSAPVSGDWRWLRPGPR